MSAIYKEYFNEDVPTVGELKKLLNEFPDDLKVAFFTPESVNVQFPSKDFTQIAYIDTETLGEERVIDEEHMKSEKINPKTMTKVLFLVDGF